MSHPNLQYLNGVIAKKKHKFFIRKNFSEHYQIPKQNPQQQNPNNLMEAIKRSKDQQSHYFRDNSKLQTDKSERLDTLTIEGNKPMVKSFSQNVKQFATNDSKNDEKQLNFVGYARSQTQNNQKSGHHTRFRTITDILKSKHSDQQKPKTSHGFRKLDIKPQSMPHNDYGAAFAKPVQEEVKAINSKYMSYQSQSLPGTNRDHHKPNDQSSVDKQGRNTIGTQYEKKPIKPHKPLHPSKKHSQSGYQSSISYLESLKELCDKFKIPDPDQSRQSHRLQDSSGVGSRSQIGFLNIKQIHSSAQSFAKPSSGYGDSLFGPRNQITVNSLINNKQSYNGNKQRHVSTSYGFTRPKKPTSSSNLASPKSEYNATRKQDTADTTPYQFYDTRNNSDVNPFSTMFNHKRYSAQLQEDDYDIDDREISLDEPAESIKQLPNSPVAQPYDNDMNIKQGLFKKSPTKGKQTINEFIVSSDMPLSFRERIRTEEKAKPDEQSNLLREKMRQESQIQDQYNGFGETATTTYNQKVEEFERAGGSVVDKIMSAQDDLNIDFQSLKQDILSKSPQKNPLQVTKKSVSSKQQNEYYKRTGTANSSKRIKTPELKVYSIRKGPNTPLVSPRNQEEETSKLEDKADNLKGSRKKIAIITSSNSKSARKKNIISHKRKSSLSMNKTGKEEDKQTKENLPPKHPDTDVLYPQENRMYKSSSAMFKSANDRSRRGSAVSLTNSNGTEDVSPGGGKSRKKKSARKKKKHVTEYVRPAIELDADLGLHHNFEAKSNFETGIILERKLANQKGLGDGMDRWGDDDDVDLL